jgi:hypothetical protein
MRWRNQPLARECLVPETLCVPSFWSFAAAIAGAAQADTGFTDIKRLFSYPIGKTNE